MTESMVESRAERKGEKGDREPGYWQAAGGRSTTPCHRVTVPTCPFCFCYPPNTNRYPPRTARGAVPTLSIRWDFVLGAGFVAFAPSLGPGRVIASGNVRAGLLHEIL